MVRYEQTRKIVALSKVYQHGKTQIPKDVRESLNIRDGDKLLWVREEGKWVVEKA